MDTLLSIIVPIYGVEQYLRQCVDSILAACEGICSEVILVDDGGNDGCPAICDDYAKNTSKSDGQCAVRVIHKKNGGYGSAVNAGFDIARGEWISIVEPDDWVEDGMYRTLLSDVEDGNVDIVKATFQYALPSGDVQRKSYGTPPLGTFMIKDYPALLCDHPSIWSAVYRRSFLISNKIRMIEAPGAGWVDNPFLVQTMCLARGIRFKPEVVYNYRSLRNAFRELNGKWEIPYARMKDEITWFSNNPVDPDVLCSRYRVYQFYLMLMSQCAVVYGHIDKVAAAVNDISSNLNWDAIHSTTALTKSNKMALRLYRDMPHLAILRFRNRWTSKMISGLVKAMGCFFK